MPTDQRELEYHHLPVQTIAEGTLPGALQPYGSPVTNWATSRSSLTVQSVEAHNSDSDFWGVKAPRHFEHLASSHLPKHCVPEHSAYSSFYMPSPHLATMDPSSPSMKRCKKLVDRGCDFKFLPEQSESSLSSPWIGQHNSYHNSNSYNHHVKLEDSEVASHYIPTASSSPISTSSQHYHSTTTSMTTEDSPKAHLSGEDDLPTDPPYSQLIYQALRESKDCKLQLQDIYYWFEKNTNKGKEATKGWQNSIRHNLSMNAVSSPHLTIYLQLCDCTLKHDDRHHKYESN